MFLRIDRVKNKKTGKTYEYLRILESYKVKGKSKKRVIANLGRVDQISKEKLHGLVIKLREFLRMRSFTEEEVSGHDSSIVGYILIIREVWRMLGLDRILEEIFGRR